MKFDWKNPHNLNPRLVRALAGTGVFILLCAGMCSIGTYPPAAQSFRQETEPSPEIPAQSRTEDTSAETSSEPASDTEGASETASAEMTETESAAKDASGDYIDTEVAQIDLETEEAASESSTEPSFVIIKHAAGSPLAEPDDTLSVLQEDARLLVQFQPDYLDLTKTSLSWEHLEEELASMTEGYSGNWSVYVKDLSNGEVININENPMESASLIKLFIMGAVMEQISDGVLEETDTIDRLLREMITVSDNEAANELVRCLSEDHDHEDGLSFLNSFAERQGFSDTRQVNGLEDPSLRHSPSDINRTSARDCGELLARIYDGTLVSHLASRKMEDLLLDQEITYKIPAALPDETISANKTGEVSDAENDSAIIYSPGGDFVLCIMSCKWDSGNQAITHIREISKMVYNHFNPPQTEMTVASEE